MPRIIDAFSQFFDDNGDPLINGKLKFVESGTNNTDKDTFADINETIANTNPVILDGAGRCPNVFGTGSYNVISYTSADVQIQQFDPVSGDTLEGAFSEWNAITIYSEGDIVTGSDGLYYRSISPGNQNQNPISTPGQWEEVKFVGIWNTVISYDAGDTVYGSDGILYYSLIAANVGNDPTTDDANWRSYLFNTSPNILDNIGFTATTASKALTFALKTKALTDPTSLDAVDVAFRSETLTTGDYDIVPAIAAESIVVPSGATLGFEAVEQSFIYLYAINNAGDLELGVSASILDETVVHTTVAISAAADSGTVLYSTTLRTNIPIRLIGRIKITTGAVAGEWDNAPTELYVGKTVAAAVQLGGEYIKLSDVKGATVSGGTFTAGAWQTRDLNTEDDDTGDNCTLSANQFTLDAGTYIFEAIAPAYQVDRHIAKLYNITDATDVLIGTKAFSGGIDDSNSVSHVSGLFTILSAKTFELQHRCQSTVATVGFGSGAFDLGVSSIYSAVNIRKVA
jgi:hypothetical protein